jgi:hypothetical protein
MAGFLAKLAIKKAISKGAQKIGEKAGSGSKAPAQGSSATGGALKSYFESRLAREKKPGIPSGGGGGGMRTSHDDTGDSYHKGGRVRKTGKARLKKGEVVLTAKQARKMRSRKSRSK